MSMTRLGSSLILAAIALIVSGIGCNKIEKTVQQAKGKADSADTKGEGKPAAAHEGWWCQEHGVPEDLCSICMSEANAKKKFKDNGDWCKIHDRASSQCFKCDPTRYKKFEDMYIAKYNKKPEPPPKEEFENK